MMPAESFEAGVGDEQARAGLSAVRSGRRRIELSFGQDCDPTCCFQAPRLCRPARTPYDTLNLPDGAGVEWRKDQ